VAQSSKQVRAIHMARRLTEDVWVAVKVERGLPVEARGYRSRASAKRQERRWRKRMNLDYDDTGVFDVHVVG